MGQGIRGFACCNEPYEHVPVIGTLGLCIPSPQRCVRGILFLRGSTPQPPNRGSGTPRTPSPWTASSAPASGWAARWSSSRNTVPEVT